MKNAVKISFLAVPKLGLAIKNYTLTGLTAVIKRGPDEFQYDALKLVEKTFVLEVESFSIIYTIRKVFLYLFSWKREKKVIFGQIGLDFSARQGQTVSSKIF